MGEWVLIWMIFQSELGTTIETYAALSTGEQAGRGAAERASGKRRPAVAGAGVSGG